MCFVFEDPVHLYFIFRQFYIKYFFNLHHISASPNVRILKINFIGNKMVPFQAIVGLCVLFECLLRQISPELWFHLQEIQVQP
jgi:hypothetical protein